MIFGIVIIENKLTISDLQKLMQSIFILLNYRVTRP